MRNAVIGDLGATGFTRSGICDPGANVWQGPIVFARSYPRPASIGLSNAKPSFGFWLCDTQRTLNGNVLATVR